MSSRTAARRAIDDGRVVVGGVTSAKAATLVAAADPIDIARDQQDWAGRGALKLVAGLDAFAIDPDGANCLDVGASTGGFTDVLLHRGAARVAAVDVGYGQLIWRLQSDSRVAVFDRTNFRTTDPATFGSPFDLVVVDVSFISVRLLAGRLAEAGRDGCEYVILVKPQFEAGRDQVGRDGIVRDAAIRVRTVHTVAGALTDIGIAPQDVIRSPITGARGNVEILLYCIAGATPGLSVLDVEEACS